MYTALWYCSMLLIVLCIFSQLIFIRHTERSRYNVEESNLLLQYSNQTDTNVELLVLVKKNVYRNFASVIIGGGVAVFSAPVIFGTLISYTILPTYATLYTSVASGIIGGFATQGVAELIEANPVTVVKYNAYNAQIKFRKAVIRYFTPNINSAIRAIRSGVYLNTNDKFMVQSDISADAMGKAISLEYGIHIIYNITIFKNEERTFDTSQPPRQLRSFAENATAKFILPHQTIDTISNLMWGGLLGATAGIIGGICSTQFIGFTWIRTVPTTNIGIFVGIPTLAGAAGSIVSVVFDNIKVIDIYGAVLLASEIKEHIARLIDCAIDNGAEITVKMTVSVGELLRAGFPDEGIKDSIRTIIDIQRST